MHTRGLYFCFGNHFRLTPPLFAILPILFPGRTPVKDSVRTPLARGASVDRDWRAWLPQEQEKVFRIHVQELESNYTMLSVSLNEALELRREQSIGQSLQAVSFSSELCLLLTGSLSGLLRALYEHAKHYGTIPNTAPLDSANFQGQKSQKSARLSNLLSHVLLSHRLQFLYKVSILGEMVEDLGTDYCLCAADLSDETSPDPSRIWELVDADHYDLNTCLREAIVLLKSFLLVLPADQIGAFQRAILEQSKPRHSEVHERLRGIRHRRTTLFAGQ